MSLLSWFKGTRQTRHGHNQGEREVPLAANARNLVAAKDSVSRSSDAASDTAARRKSERARLRDLLYNVVRESMVRVGVLSSSFKFKVLATDPRGRKFIVMMDLSRDFGSEIAQLAEIEALICQAAKARHNIVVSSVYWRAEDRIAGTQTGSTHADGRERVMAPQAMSGIASEKEAPTTPKPKFDPVLADEVNALKRALAAGEAGVGESRPHPAGGKSPKNYTLLTGFENTEIIESELPEAESAETEFLDEDARQPALSPTQYGELR